MIPITRALSAEHQMFRAVFDQVEELLPRLDRLEEVKRLARLVEGLLLSHAKVEGDLMILAQDHEAAGRHRYDHCRHEHEEIDSQLTLVHSARTIARARKLLRGALAASRKHFQREERGVFPLIEKRMQPEALIKLGTVWFLQRHAPANWTV
jgi:hypothetical protein